MHFINAYRAQMRVLRGALPHPVFIIPLITGINNNGSCFRRHLVEALHRVSFLLPLIISIQYFIFIAFPCFDPGDKQFPYAAGPEFAHGMLAAPPSVEIPDNAYSPRIRRPDCERRPRHGTV